MVVVVFFSSTTIFHRRLFLLFVRVADDPRLQRSRKQTNNRFLHFFLSRFTEFDRVFDCFLAIFFLVSYVSIARLGSYNCTAYFFYWVLKSHTFSSSNSIFPNNFICCLSDARVFRKVFTGRLFIIMMTIFPVIFVFSFDVGGSFDHMFWSETVPVRFFLVPNQVDRCFSSDSAENL